VERGLNANERIRAELLRRVPGIVAAFHEKIRRQANTDCSIVVRHLQQAFPMLPASTLMTQFATIPTRAQLPQVPCVWGLHAEIEQPMVLFVL